MSPTNFSALHAVLYTLNGKKKRRKKHERCNICMRSDDAVVFNGWGGGNWWFQLVTGMSGIFYDRLEKHTPDDIHRNLVKLPW